MPISVERDLGHQHIVATASGPVSLALLLEFVRTVRVGDERRRPLLIDARTATFEMTQEDLRDVIAPAMGHLRAVDGDRAPVAIIVNDGAAFKTARRFETLVSAQGVAHLAVFREMDTAEQWLAGIVDPRR